MNRYEILSPACFGAPKYPPNNPKINPKYTLPVPPRRRPRTTPDPGAG
jgi:hypothetical protein